MKNQEIERKFLVNIEDVPYDLESMDYGDIIQGYITSIDHTFSFRVRQTLTMNDENGKIGEKYTQTIKSKDNKVRDEYEIVLEKEQFSTLWRLCVGNSVHKLRYELPYKNHTIELDVYKNEVDGLYTVEVEFDTLGACDMFEPPEWFGEEVTELEEYKNLNIALNKGVSIWYGKLAHETLEIILNEFDETKIESIITNSLYRADIKHKREYIETLVILAQNVMLNRLNEPGSSSLNYDEKAIKIIDICSKINQERIINEYETK